MKKIVHNISLAIINKIKENKDKYSTKELSFVCGPMGSGKTTFILSKLLNNSHMKSYYSSIDELIPYFKKFEITDSRIMYKLCRQVGIEVTDYLLENNISMIIEGTGINKDMYDYLLRVKEKGYHITTYFLKTDLNICRERVKIRNKHSQHKVMDEDVILYHKILWDGIDTEQKTEQLFVSISDDVKYISNYSSIPK